MSTGWEGCNERVRLGGEFLMFVITSAFLTFLFWFGLVWRVFISSFNCL